MMKIYRLISLALMAGAFASCDDGLYKDASLADVTVTENENVVCEGVTVNVKKGSPIEFNFIGEPDNIVFFSGEEGHNYDYRNRTTVDISQIKSSKLTFSIRTYQYGDEISYKDVLHMYMSTGFDGLNKNDFEADCEMLEGFQWDELVPADQLPTNKSQNLSYDIDMTSYLGENITLAISYKGKSVEAVQGTYYFDNMKVVNEYNNGKTVEVSAAEFGFTPVNVSSTIADSERDNVLKNQSSYWDTQGNLIVENLYYGTVTNNTPGIWNLSQLSDSGSFQIYGSSKQVEGDAKKSNISLKDTWLVSDHIVVNSCLPDQGVAIKNMANRLTTYEYTYNQVGTYKAVFLMNNSNYKNEDSKVVTMVINVK